MACDRGVQEIRGLGGRRTWPLLDTAFRRALCSPFRDARLLTLKPTRRTKERLMDPKRVMQYAVDEQVKFVDLRFTDLPGAWHHLTIPIGAFTEESVDSRIGC